MAKSSSKKAAPAAVKLDTGRLEHIAFGQLAVSPLNVRKDATVGPEDELVASIRSHGLLQPLVGYIAKSGPATVLICAGQRRLLALAHIAGAETPIPVRIVDEDTAIEVSLAENLARKDFNPADELAAFNALIATGHYDANRIADRFGFERRYVRRRLKMAVLAPEILDALREGAIGVGSAEAYAATDDLKIQLKIFKEHSRPNAWEAHSPARILRAVLETGIKADSRVGIFVGGLEAYEAEGGACKRDDAFTDLFAGAAFAQHSVEEIRLTDSTIVDKLLERAQARVAADVEKAAIDKYPFVTGIEWMDLFGQYGPAMPKLPKKSELVAVEPYWNASADQITKAAAKAAKEPGAKVIALISLDEAGQPRVEPGRFQITREAWAKAKPKEEERSTYRQETPEERAARERETAIAQTARNLYGRSLVGATPGFVVTDCKVDWHGNVSVVLRAEGERDDIVQVERQYGGAEFAFKPEVLAPFLEDATVKADEQLKQAERAKEEAEKAKRRGIEEFDAQLGRLRSTVIGEWPAKTTVTIDGYELLIMRMDGDEAVLRVEPEDDEPWETTDIEHLVEVIRDNSNGADEYSIETSEGSESGADEPAELQVA